MSEGVNNPLLLVSRQQCVFNLQQLDAKANPPVLNNKKSGMYKNGIIEGAVLIAQDRSAAHYGEAEAGG